MYGSTSTQTATGVDPFGVRITIVTSAATTGQNAEVIVVYTTTRKMGFSADPYVEFAARALTALERRQARMRAAFELRLVEERHRRLATPPRPVPGPRRAARVCSLAGAWRARR